MNLERNSDLAALLLRCGTGLLFLAHGFYLKVMVFGIEGTVGFFGSLGYPAVLAYGVILAETLGGIMLILGIGTRWVALTLLPVLFGAAAVHWSNGWLFSAPNGGWEYPAFWALTLVVLALVGDGRYSLVHRLRETAGSGARNAGTD